MEPRHHQAVDVIEPDSPRARGDGAKEGNSFNSTGQKQAQKDMSRPAGEQSSDVPRANNKDDESSRIQLNNDLRGWLLAVAALFVTLAFEAVLQMPDWLDPQWFSAKGLAAKSTRQTATADLYLVTLGFIFATSLVVVLLLLSERCTLAAVKSLMWLLSLYLACAFAMRVSAEWRTILTMVAMIGVYAALIGAFIVGVHTCVFNWCRRMMDS